jgi:uncharacterized protein YfiM (DUF2279 family)
MCRVNRSESGPARPSIALVFALFILAASARPAAAQDRWFSADKLLHFVGALAATTLSYSLAYDGFGWDRDESRNFAVAAATTLSVGKEVYDMLTDGQPSVRDLLWDGMGIGAGVLLINQRDGSLFAGSGGGVPLNPGLSTEGAFQPIRPTPRPTIGPAGKWLSGRPGRPIAGLRLNPIDTPSGPFSLRILQVRPPGD